MEEDILGKSQRLGHKLYDRFARWEKQFLHVANPRHLGAMAAFELVESKESHQPKAELAAGITKKAQEKGLILLACGLFANSIRFLMPITIEDDVLEEGLNIVEECLKEVGA